MTVELKGTVESLEEIAAPYREMYKEENGKYILDVVGVVPVEKFTMLKHRLDEKDTVLDKSMTVVTELRTKLAEKETTAAELAKQVQEYHNKVVPQAEIDKRVQELAARQSERAIQERDARFEALNKEHKRQLAEREKEKLDLLEAHIATKLDAAYNAVPGITQNEMLKKSILAELRSLVKPSTDDYKSSDFSLVCVNRDGQRAYSSSTGNEVSVKDHIVSLLKEKDCINTFIQRPVGTNTSSVSMGQTLREEVGVDVPNTVMGQAQAAKRMGLSQAEYHRKFVAKAK